MLKILHVTLEAPIDTGLLNVLKQFNTEVNRNQLQVALITPHHTLYDRSYSQISFITTVVHMFNGIQQSTDIFRAILKNASNFLIYHYIAKPTKPIIFDRNSTTNTFSVYYNSAFAAFIREVDSDIPNFDIIHLHNWQTGLSAALIKEYESHMTRKEPRPMPYVISSLYKLCDSQADTMLLNKEIFTSIGFKSHPPFMKQTALNINYSDLVCIHSKIGIKNIMKGKSNEYIELLRKANDHGRLSDSCDQLLSIYEKVCMRPVRCTKDFEPKDNRADAMLKHFSLHKLKQKEQLITRPAKVLHVAMEYGDATLGGLGSVATQMVDAQNKFEFQQNRKFESSIITPYYKKIYKSYNQLALITQVDFLFNHKPVKANIFLAQTGNNKHYMVESIEEYSNLFETESVCNIYTNNLHSLLIDRIKYFNAAVAVFLNNSQSVLMHPQPDVLQLHDWQVSLVPQLLTELYDNHQIKSIFIVHIDNADNGTYASQKLNGIGLNFEDGYHILKGIGLNAANKIVTVSPSFLTHCMTSKSNNPSTESLRRIFVMSNIRDNKAIGILNGINYDKYCPVGKLISDQNNIYAEKYRLKHELFTKLRANNSSWKIDQNLPLILYIGRFSFEKGIDTFAQVIEAVKGKAVFIALGRGKVASIFDLILQHNFKTDNVYISCDECDQQQYGDLIRACADFTFVPSHREACGLVPMEGFAAGAACIASKALRDSVCQISIDGNILTGNSFIFEIQTNDQLNPSLIKALEQALRIWDNMNPAEKNALQTQIMQDAKKFDWLAPSGSLHKYSEVISELLEEPQAAAKPLLRLYA